MLENPKFETQEDTKKSWEELQKESWFPEIWKKDYEVFQYSRGVHPENIIEKGIIETLTPNIPVGILYETKWEDLDTYWKAYKENSAFGVADNVVQIKEYFKKQIEDPQQKFWIQISKIYQSQEPTSGGFRWHKNGPYIGKMDHQCEYLYDEDFTMEPTWKGYVIIFHCHLL